MTRGSFFKSLFGLIVAPTVIKDIDWAIPKVQNNYGLISDLQLLTPQYYRQYIEKYGNSEYEQWLATYSGSEIVSNGEFYWFENK